MEHYAFGADLGGTTCKIGFFRDNGELLEKWEIPTDTSNNGENILKDIAAAVHNKMKENGLEKEQVLGVGIGVPGPVTPDGSVNRCVNLGWGKFPIEKEFSDLLGLPAKAGNDANVAALGEAWAGSGKDYGSIVMVTLGTGLGGGIIVNQQILMGAHGAGGEIGHMVVNEEENETCGCGQHGCIEQYASATGIARLARKHLAESSMDSSLRALDKVTSKDVFDAAKAGDPLANEIADDACRMLAGALKKIAVVVDPDAFIIGGGVSKAGEILTDRIKKFYLEEGFHACKDTEIRLASLGNDAGMYGSVRLVLR